MRATISMLTTVSALLAACSTPVPSASAPQGDPISRVCRPEAAAELVGHAAPDDVSIQQRTGAVLIRRTAPGDAVTHDFRENRITLAIDPAGNVVLAICG